MFCLKSKIEGTAYLFFCGFSWKADFKTSFSNANPFFPKQIFQGIRLKLVILIELLNA